MGVHQHVGVQCTLCIIMVTCCAAVQAIADHFGVKMYVITSYPEGEIIEINPNGPLHSQRVLYLSFWAEVCCAKTNTIVLRKACLL